MAANNFRKKSHSSNLIFGTVTQAFWTPRSGPPRNSLSVLGDMQLNVLNDQAC